MKKLLAILLCAIFILPALSACGETGGEGGGCGHAVTVRATYTEEGGKVYKEYYCGTCAKDIKEQITVAGIVDEENELTAIQESKDFQNNSTILIKKGTYSTMYVTDAKIGTKIVCEDDVIVKILRFEADSAEITVENMNFYSPSTESASRLDINGLVSGLAIKYCTFKGNSQVYAYSQLAQDFSIENCTFTDIYNNSGSGMSLTAILVRNFDGLAVKDCVFENVQYNALQIGAKGGVGDLIITGNTFKNIGSRVLHTVSSEPAFCDISGNTFYKNSVGSGSYFNTNGFGSFTIGVNTWESIPPKENFYINPVTAGRIEYNPEEQIQLD